MKKHLSKISMNSECNEEFPLFDNQVMEENSTYVAKVNKTTHNMKTTELIMLAKIEELLFQDSLVIHMIFTSLCKNLVKLT